MGMDQKVVGPVPPWPRVAELLAAHGHPAQMRMIDGQLAFPDEEPPEAWQELRVGTPGGMVTLRREPDGVRLVTWGNADDAMRRAWNAVTWAVARAGGGTVGGAGADEFGRGVELPDGSRPSQ